MVNKPFATCMRQVMQRFPKKPGLPDWSLTVSNAERRKINKHINDQLHNSKGGIWVEAAHQLDRQGFWLFPSLHVVGCATDAGIYNGQLYTVMAASKDLIKLQVYNGSDEVDINMCNVRNVKPAHAITYYSCQGRTLKGRVRLYVQHPKMTTTHLIVGLSRATSPDLVDTK